MTIALVTDSCADISPQLAAEHHITVIPDLIMIGSETMLDGEGLTRKDFYDRLPSLSPLPTTAAPSMAVFESVYQRLAKDGASGIISVHPSPKLSALHSIAQKAAEAISIPIRVIDSASVSLGMGFQVISAAQHAARGASLNEIVDWLDSLRKRARVFALLDTLENVRRSGRVSWVSAALGSVLGLKAIIEVRDGVVHRLGLSRSRRQAVTMLISHLRSLGPLDRLAVLHTSYTQRADIDQVVACAPIDVAPEMIMPVTPVIGTHVGPNGLGFAAVQQ